MTEKNEKPKISKMNLIEGTIFKIQSKIPGGKVIQREKKIHTHTS